ncbi:hypothetical protein HK405_003862, partial [Cladochytrium tenue]
VLIIGAGTAGPALALALKRYGHDVEIFERAEPASKTGVWEPGDVGGGFTLFPNFQRVLKRLGVLGDLTPDAIHLDHVDYLRLDGTLITHWPVFNKDSELRMFGTLRSSVAKAISSAMGKEGVIVHAGKRLVAIEQPTDGTLGVRAVFEDGTSAAGDILVGADGVNSATRGILFPEVKPVRTEYVGYLGVSEHGGELLGISNSSLTFLSDVATGRGTWASLAAPGRSAWCMFEARKGGEIVLDGAWQATADVASESSTLAEMAERWGLPDWFRQMIPKANRIIPVNFSYLEPMASWHKHNCVIIGDAAHAVVPFAGNGAAIALEDTEALATLLSKLPDNPQRAFELLYEIRASRTYAVSKEAITIGERSHAPSKFAGQVGNLVMKVMSFATRMLGRNFNLEWITEYDSHQATLDTLKKHGISPSVAPLPAPPPPAGAGWVALAVASGVAAALATLAVKLAAASAMQAWAAEAAVRGTAMAVANVVMWTLFTRALAAAPSSAHALVVNSGANLCFALFRWSIDCLMTIRQMAPRTS